MFLRALGEVQPVGVDAGQRQCGNRGGAGAGVGGEVEALFTRHLSKLVLISVTQRA